MRVAFGIDLSVGGDINPTATQQDMTELHETGNEFLPAKNR
jgi:hypothetical protein